ncbi:extracellular solute-binding protein family 1 [Treponema brennaborense DSM 12168]|uniref:Extracellular solute-binding protein family 1 n=2 Tax=Treponema TaxID=157 RepID=F4LNV9_TREBD|nr:extracellular solute-binding protein family 1 [Treponema brennaborense DSM 12168]
MLRLCLLLCVIAATTACAKRERQAESNVPKSSAAEAELVIYSPHYTDKTEFIIREFRQRTGITVELVYQGTTELLERLAHERESGVHTADVFWGGGIESLEANTALFAPYRSSQLDAINPAYCDPEQYWTGFSVMTMVLVYNTDLVPADKIPRTWRDLLDPFFAHRIIMPDPMRSGSAYSILNAILSSERDGGDEWVLLRELKNAAGTGGLAAASSQVHSAVATGEYFAGLTAEDAALPETAAGQPLAIVYPADGTIAVPDGVALVKDAPHAENAKRFIDFVLGPDVQQLVPVRWYRRSVRNDIPLPAGAESFSKLRILPYDVFAAARSRERILQTWQAFPPQSAREP